jgi:hypothetical protein
VVRDYTARSARLSKHNAWGVDEDAVAGGYGIASIDGEHRLHESSVAAFGPTKVRGSARAKLRQTYPTLPG